MAARPSRPSAAAAAAAFEISPAAARVVSLGAFAPAGLRIRAPPRFIASRKHFARALPIAQRGRGRLCVSPELTPGA
jgi:hypothetical protein